jgi:hypothetical protein
VLKFIASMLIPLWIFVYTVQFGRWMQKKKLRVAAVSVYVVACLSVAVAGAVFWKVYL